MSKVQSPTGTVTQVCTCSLGWSNSSPLRRSRIAPSTSVSVQVWQMPIRQPNGMPKPVLTGFLSEKQEAKGRPVGVAIDRQGALLVADDVGNRIWRVVPQGASARLAP